jgi:hypothetical protein
MNIFILADEPRVAFERLRSMLPGDFAGAYREADGKTYFVLFPLGRKDFDVR